MKIHEDEIEEKKIFRRIKTMIAAIALLSQKIQTYVCEFLLSHPAWGGWIEINRQHSRNSVRCRSYGGLKSTARP